MSASNDVSEHLIETSTAAAAVTVSGATETTEAVSDFTAKELAPENSSTQHNNQVQPSCSKNFAADNQRNLIYDNEAMTVPVVEGSLAVENQPSLPVGVGVGTSVGGATTSGNSSTAMGSPVTSGLPFLSAVDSLTSVSPILQSLFSRIEAEFQTLVQENARLHSENAKLSQRMEQLQQYISSNTSMNNNNPNFCMSSTGSTINNNNMDDSGLLDPSPSSQANMPRAPAVMGSGPNSETCTPVSSVILSNNNTNLLPMSAVGGAGGGTAIASMPNQSVAASSTTDQKTRLRMAQRTKTGLTKIVSTFKAGTLDAVNSGAIGAISSRTGGGSNSTVAKCSTVYSGHSDSVWDLDWNAEWDVIASASSDRTVRLWLPGHGAQAVYSYTGHQGTVNSARLHPSEPLVLSAGGDGSVHIWRYSRERMQQRRNTLSSTRNLQSSGDDDVLVDDPSVEFPSVVSSCAVGGGGGGHNSHITSSGDIFENDTSIAATNDWTLQPPINVRQPEVVVCASPYASNVPYSVLPASSSLSATGPVMAAEFLGGPVAGNVVVSGGWDQHLVVADALTGRRIHTNEGHEGVITNISCAKSSTLYASSSEDRTFRVWDLNNPKMVYVCEGHSRKVRTAVFCETTSGASTVGGDLAGSGGGSGPFPLILSASDDCSLKLWDLRNMSSPLISIRANSGINRFSILSSPNVAASLSGCSGSGSSSSEILAACPLDNRSIRIYSLNMATARARRLASIPSAGTRLIHSASSVSNSHRSSTGRSRHHNSSRAFHSRMVTSVAWSSSEKKLISASIDGSILEWKLTKNSSKQSNNNTASSNNNNNNQLTNSNEIASNNIS